MEEKDRAGAEDEKNQKEKEMSRGHSKGASYEREVCKLLSKWWTGGERSDIFWRTSISGGRATTRMKKGKSTFGQVGDMQATDPIGQPLIDLCVIEMKRGYGMTSFMDDVEVSPSRKNEPLWSEWVTKAMMKAKESNTPYWLLITKRNGKERMIFMPRTLRQKLVQVDEDFARCLPTVFINLPKGNKRIFGVTLDNFFRHVKPKTIELLHHLYWGPNGKTK